jgi:glycosidase
MAVQRIAACVILATACVTTYAPAQRAAPAPNTPQVERSAIYEVFVRDFSPPGNFHGLADGLDRIQQVGANVVWLMPIYPIGKMNRKGSLGSPYSVADYRAINPDFGNEADFRTLVRAVHTRGMKLILDFVPNHTAFDHVWVAKFPSRYTHDSSGKISVALDNDGKPTDWTDVADLNFNNADTRQAVIADMRYWLEKFDIDGFRVDVAGFVPDAFWREAVPQLRAVKPILLLAEWGDPKMHEFGFDLTYGWDSYSRLKAVWKGAPADSFVVNELTDMRSLPRQGRRLRFTTNHDETAWDQPPVTLFDGSAGARAAFVAMALLPGVPLIYDGQEAESPQKLGLFEKETVAWDQPDAVASRSFYRRVIDLTRQHPAFATNDVTPVPTDAPKDVIAYHRGSVIVLVNARSRALRVRATGRDLNGMRDLLTGKKQDGVSVSLPAFGAVVLEPASSRN